MSSPQGRMVAALKEHGEILLTSRGYELWVHVGRDPLIDLTATESAELEAAGWPVTDTRGGRR